jgi:hypothetical protein
MNGAHAAKTFWFRTLNNGIDINNIEPPTWEEIQPPAESVESLARLLRSHRLRLGPTTQNADEIHDLARDLVWWLTSIAERACCEAEDCLGDIAYFLYGKERERRVWDLLGVCERHAQALESYEDDFIWAVKIRVHRHDDDDERVEFEELEEL